MILAVDVSYNHDHAKVVGLLFDWSDNKPKHIFVEYCYDIEDYIPGEFYRRELPCILKLLASINLTEVSVIVVDGYVYINDDFKYGLGGFLWKSLNETIPIIGVAKNPFTNNTQTVKEVFRGDSKKPLYVSSIGYPLDLVAEHVKLMSGEFRVPKILKELDRLTKYDAEC